MNHAPPTNALLDFTDADLKRALGRALKTVLSLAAILFVGVTVFAGWQSGMLLMAGALIAASSVYEAQRLIIAVNQRLDNAQNATPTGRVVAMFVLRLILAGAILYGSLKCFHGSIYALVAGLCLSLVALSIEAVRLIRA